MTRAFVAIDLPDPVRGALTVLQFLLPLPDRVEPAQFHLTLSFLDDLRDAELEAVHEALAALRMPAFALTLAGLGLFGGATPRLAYAGVAPEPALLRLHAKVETAARRAGASIPARRFVPHVTLGRFRHIAAEDALRLERAVAGHMDFRAGPFPVADFALIESRLHRDGARHTVLARYPLDGSSAVIA